MFPSGPSWEKLTVSLDQSLSVNSYIVVMLKSNNNNKKNKNSHYGLKGKVTNLQDCD